jgi:excisionase family DNA binding protein
MNTLTREKGGVPPDEGRLFLNAEEVGRQLGLRRSRVYELAAAGLLPVVRLGRRLRFPRHGLEELAEAAILHAKSGGRTAGRFRG